MAQAGTAKPPRTAATPVRVVVNANASGAVAKLRRSGLVQALRDAGAEVALDLTETPGEFEALWREDDRRRLVLVGGDGTIHAAANMGGPPRDVALIPAGRANNIARSLRIPLEWSAAAELAVRGEVRPLDLIEVRTRERRLLVVESVSVGFLAEARVRYHGRNSADLFAGLRAGAAALVRFHPLCAHVDGPSGDETVRLSQLFVANLPLYEFGLHVAPRADPTDATLDLIGIDAPSRLAVLRMLWDLRRGVHLSHRGVHAWRSAAATIATGGCSPIVADSTDIGYGPVDLRALPGALRLVRP
jgi:diacylglycerol kinase family enzyme